VDNSSLDEIGDSSLRPRRDRIADRFACERS
jgi:hypothetical protein